MDSLRSIRNGGTQMVWNRQNLSCKTLFSCIGVELKSPVLNRDNARCIRLELSLPFSQVQITILRTYANFPCHDYFCKLVAIPKVASTSLYLCAACAFHQSCSEMSRCRIGRVAVDISTSARCTHLLDESTFERESDLLTWPGYSRSLLHSASFAASQEGIFVILTDCIVASRAGSEIWEMCGPCEWTRPNQALRCKFML